MSISLVCAVHKGHQEHLYRHKIPGTFVKSWDMEQVLTFYLRHGLSWVALTLIATKLFWVFEFVVLFYHRLVKQ